MLSPALAVNPDEILADPALEAQAREISRDLRCVVCQNQSIDDSDSAIARDMRLKLRALLSEGYGEPEIKDFFVTRYGEYVLLKPRFGGATLWLWLLPMLMFVAALGLLAFVFLARGRRQAQAALTPQSLSADEQAELDALLKDKT